MVDLVGVEHSKFSLCLHLRRKMPFENTPILGRQILIYPVCRLVPNFSFEPLDEVRWSWLSEKNYRESSTLGG